MFFQINLEGLLCVTFPKFQTLEKFLACVLTFPKFQALEKFSSSHFEIVIVKKIKKLYFIQKLNSKLAKSKKEKCKLILPGTLSIIFISIAEIRSGTPCN